VVSNNLSPTWKPCKVAMASLCNCDEHRPLLLEVCGLPLPLPLPPPPPLPRHQVGLPLELSCPA
jgi:hypothetical protein